MKNFVKGGKTAGEGKRLSVATALAGIREYSDFLSHVRCGHALSLTEIADFLRSGLLQGWCELTPNQRSQTLYRLERHIPKTPARKGYVISRDTSVLFSWTMSREEAFSNALVLEALRLLLSSHLEVGAVQWLWKRMREGRQFSFGPIPLRTAIHLWNKKGSVWFPHPPSPTP